VCLKSFVYDYCDIIKRKKMWHLGKRQINWHQLLQIKANCGVDFVPFDAFIVFFPFIFSSSVVVSDTPVSIH